MNPITYNNIAPVSREDDITTPSETVRLAGKILPLTGPPNVTGNGRFQGKVTFGDYSHDSDPITSSWVIASLVGGIGNEHLKEGVDDETYWTGSLETRHPGMITLLPETLEFTGPVTGAAYPLGDFPPTSPQFYCTFGSTIARFNVGTQEFDSIGVLPGVPVGKGVVYANKMWIPLGINGYATLDSDGDIQTETDLNVVHFSYWDNKLAALTTENALRIKFGELPWEDEEDDLILPAGALPRRLVVFRNQEGYPTLHLITSEGVWAYDRQNQILMQTELQYPRHPSQGRAACNWRGEALYVSVGIGIHMYTGGLINSMGPDGRYGLPENLRGTITDLEPEYNALLALVQGSTVTGEKNQDYTLATGQYGDRLDPFPDSVSYSSLLRWTGRAWHPAWLSDDATGTPTWAYVSIASNEYYLWWGYGSTMLRQKLPLDQYTPLQGMRVGESRFAQRGELLTGWFDADMPAYDKLASHIEVVLDDVLGNGRSTGKVQVYMQKDYSTAWTLVGDATKPGRTVLPFNLVERAGGPFRDGQSFRRVRFRLVFSSTNPLYSPVLSSFQIRFLKLPVPSLSWTINVDLQHPSFLNQGARELTEFLRGLSSGNQFHEFIHRDQSYSVRVAQTTGHEMTGKDNRATMQLSLIEIKVPDDEFAPIQDITV